MTLGTSADAGITREAGNGVKVHDNTEDFYSQPGGGQRRFNTGMSSADDRNIEIPHIKNTPRAI
jgi:hypothetical protein